MGILERLESRQAEIKAALQAITDTADAEERGITDEEQAEFDRLIAEHRANTSKHKTLTAQAELVDPEHRAATEQLLGGQAAGTDAPARTSLRTDPYAKGGPDSYFRDLHAASKNGDRRAIERLTVNDRHRADLVSKRNTPEARAMSTIAGAGGEFAPPLWQIDQFVGYRRPGRPLADILQHEPLPYGISSINLPRVTTGALTGIQSSQNSAVAYRDFATASVTGTVGTIAGQVIVSQQDLDQTPINLDTVILNDLSKDYDLQLDTAIIAALVAAAGITVTYTDASPTSAKVLAQLQAAIDQVAQGIYAPPQAVVMRPDRWGRLLSATDGQGRPLVLPTAKYGLFNALGLADGQTAQGVAGEVRGIAAVTDASIPNNLGTGTNQDEIIVLDPTQTILYESAPKAETFQQTYANQLSVLCRFYAYWTVIPNRLPKSIAVLSGTGMIPQAYGV